MNMTIHSNWVIKNMGLIRQIWDIIRSALCLQIGRNCSTNQRLETARISVPKILWGLRRHMTSCPTKFVLGPVSGLSENVRKLPHQSEARHQGEISGSQLKVD